MTAHSIQDEFPQDISILHELKMTDRHYQTLVERYDAVNDEIHRIESGVAAAADEHIETLKKQRLHLLDEVASMVKRARVA